MNYCPNLERDLNPTRRYSMFGGRSFLVHSCWCTRNMNGGENNTYAQFDASGGAGRFNVLHLDVKFLRLARVGAVVVVATSMLLPLLSITTILGFPPTPPRGRSGRSCIRHSPTHYACSCSHHLPPAQHTRLTSPRCTSLEVKLLLFVSCAISAVPGCTSSLLLSLLYLAGGPCQEQWS